MDDLLDDLDDGGDVDNPSEIMERTKSQAAPNLSVLDDLEDENVDEQPKPTEKKKRSRSRTRRSDSTLTAKSTPGDDKKRDEAAKRKEARRQKYLAEGKWLPYTNRTFVLMEYRVHTII